MREEQFDQDPPEQGWIDDTDYHLLRVRRYDTNDVLFDSVYVAVVEGTTVGGDVTYVASSVTKPTDQNE